MRGALLLGTLLVVGLAVAAAAGGAPARAQDVPDTCGAGSATLANPAGMETDQPAGFALYPLAEGEINRAPRSPARLQLSRITLPAAADSGLREAAGPILYYVELGAPTIAVGGVATEYGPGQSALVPMGEFFQIVNTTGQSVALLRLGLAPPSAEPIPVANVVTPPPTPPLAGADVQAAPNQSSASAEGGPSLPESTVLFHADLDALPPAPARLFLACAVWTLALDADFALAHPGPVGARVVSGELLLAGGAIIPETGCTYFAPGMPRPAGIAEQTVTAFLFGVLPDDAELWEPGGGAANSSATNVSCGAA
jgi:hypothetical protein